MYFFTADEHYWHRNIIKYCNRPFKDVREMNEELIRRHNEVVKAGDTVIHAGDFCWANGAIEIRARLNGDHVFLIGSHDKWMAKSQYRDIWEKTIQGKHIVVCHYAMLTWPRSHYGSWQLFGHSHGKMREHDIVTQYDIGVDNNNFYPVSFDYINGILA